MRFAREHGVTAFMSPPSLHLLRSGVPTEIIQKGKGNEDDRSFIFPPPPLFRFVFYLPSSERKCNTIFIVKDFFLSYCTRNLLNSLINLQKKYALIFLFFQTQSEFFTWRGLADYCCHCANALVILKGFISSHLFLSQIHCARHLAHRCSLLSK